MRINSKNVKDTFQYGVILILIITVLVLTAMIFKYKIPTENRDIAVYLIGVITAKFGDSIAFLINSTKSSSEKTDIISKLPALPLPQDTPPTNS